MTPSGVPTIRSTGTATRRRIARCFVIVPIAWLSHASAEAATFCVDTAPGLGAALTAAASNGQSDVIRLARGTYVGTFSYASTEAFGLAIEGGYAPGCVSRVVDASNTVLDANQTGTVLTVASTGLAQVVVDAVTLQNGKAVASPESQAAGLSVTCCVNNLVSLTLTNSVLRQNTLTSNGFFGAGALSYSGSGSLVLRNNVLTDNSTPREGGAVLVNGGLSIVMTGNTFRQNSASQDAGLSIGTGFCGAAVAFTNNVVADNFATTTGGGVAIGTNCNSSVTVTSNTIANNAGGNQGGGLSLRLQVETGVASVYNNIVTGNTALQGAQLYLDNDGDADGSPSPIALFNNDFAQGAGGVFIRVPFPIPPSNLNGLDPLFRDAVNGDYRLRPNSPVINQGSNAAPGLPQVDRVGNPRIVGGVVDMGAFEFVPDGSVTSQVLRYGDLFTCQDCPRGPRDTYTFSGLPDERIVILAVRTAGPLQPCLELFGPDGLLAASACDPGSSNRVDFRLTQAGTHAILVTDRTGDNTGTYNLSLQRVSPLPRFGTAVKYGQTVGGQNLAPAGDLDFVVFNGEPGSTISVEAARTAGVVQPCLELYRPDGVLVAAACDPSSGVNRIDTALAQAGTHALVVRDRVYTQTGTYSVTLRCVAGACADPVATSLAAAVLPSSRSVPVGTPATAFATIVNTSPAADPGAPRAADSTPDALGCSIVQLTGVPAQFTFQATDTATNQPIGPPDTAVNIAPGSSQSFVMALTPSAAFCSTDVQFGFSCSNGTTTTIVGLNTLELTASAQPEPDVIALAATVNADGIVSLPGPNGVGAFAVATTNVGAPGTVIASAAPSTGGLPVSLALCETNPLTGQCLAPPTPTVTTTIGTSATPTFAVFVTGTGVVPFDAAANRIFVRFVDTVACAVTGAPVTRGSTSVAVRTQ